MVSFWLAGRLIMSGTSHTAPTCTKGRSSSGAGSGRSNPVLAEIAGYRLRFNLEGRPKGRAAPANICPDPDQEVWGVLYKITRRDLLRLDSTEGVPGRGYRPTWLTAEDLDRNPIPAIAYVATGKEIDGNPSLRYISLLREGARRHGLPEHWLQFLDGVSHSE